MSRATQVSASQSIDPDWTDGDRVDWFDQSDRDRQQLLSFRQRAGSLAEIRWRGRCGGSVWRLDADRRGADGNRL